MKKPELIKKYEMKGEQLKEFPVVAIGDVLKNLRELDEPEKVTIPQFVADWIEYCKVRKITLAHALYHSEEAKNKSVYRWLFEDEDSDNQELFARAWLDGYEVEKEKRYLVKMKNILDRESFLNLSNTTKIWFFGDKKDTEYVYVHHTRKELEDAGFGWVFDCPGIKIEEQEDE